MNVWRRAAGVTEYRNIVMGLQPVAYWPMNETSGTTLTDISGNNYTGTYAGVSLAAIAGAGSTMGSQPFFDGVNDYARLGNASFLANTAYRNTGTLSLWVNLIYPGAGSVYPFRITRAAASPNAFSLELRVTTTQWLFRRGDATDTLVQVTSLHASASGWIHVAMTWTTGGNLIGYVNGSQVGSSGTVAAAASGNLNADQSSIGAVANNPASSVVTGYIGHVALFSSALPLATIATLAQAR